MSIKEDTYIINHQKKKRKKPLFDKICDFIEAVWRIISGFFELMFDLLTDTPVGVALLIAAIAFLGVFGLSRLLTGISNHNLNKLNEQIVRINNGMGLPELNEQKVENIKTCLTNNFGDHDWSYDDSDVFECVSILNKTNWKLTKEIFNADNNKKKK